MGPSLTVLLGTAQSACCSLGGINDIEGMAWEWVAPVSAAAGASVGAIAAWRTAKGGRDHAEAMAGLERRQQRFADAYVELLTTAEQFGQWAQLVRPAYDEGKPVPALPSLDRQARVNAVVAAYASPEVRKLVDDYLSIIGEIVEADRQIGDALDHNGPRVDIWEKLDLTLRPKEVAAREALGTRVSEELSPTSQPAGHGSRLPWRRTRT